uniref:Putative tick defensin n=1 Tax=Rhipicephalus microplus TaxID=6941 RepID=A0A6G5A8A4_RHIMP
MSGPSPVFLLILGITIAMINIASTSTWAIDPYGTCKSPGVRCGPPGFENSCNGTCNCQLVPRPGISDMSSRKRLEHTQASV